MVHTMRASSRQHMVPHALFFPRFLVGRIHIGATCKRHTTTLRRDRVCRRDSPARGLSPPCGPRLVCRASARPKLTAVLGKRGTLSPPVTRGACRACWPHSGPPGHVRPRPGNKDPREHVGVSLGEGIAAHDDWDHLRLYPHRRGVLVVFAVLPAALPSRVGLVRVASRSAHRIHVAVAGPARQQASHPNAASVVGAGAGAGVQQTLSAHCRHSASPLRRFLAFFHAGQPGVQARPPAPCLGSVPIV
mmetsp:Transcript_16732/g.63350  ORF Transcript_16732/g.63350 Transcript_16732/m.63350 type:complete len:247 (-) Transcript_16732:159-899(-)